MPVRFANHIQNRRDSLHLLSSGFLAFTVAGRDTPSRQYLQEMLNNDLMGKRHICVHLGIPQQMWMCGHTLCGGFRVSRGPLLVLDIYRKSIGDSALFWYEWGLLTGKAKERICMYEHKHTWKQDNWGFFCRIQGCTIKRNITETAIWFWLFSM